MTEKLTLAEFQAKYGRSPADCVRPRGSRAAKRKLELATQTLITRLGRDFSVTVTREHPFARERGRKYRFDLAIIEWKIAVEIHGGAYVQRKGGGTGGAHHTIQGRARDMAKGNLAAVMGWIVIEVSPNEVADGTAYNWVDQALAFRKGDTCTTQSDAT